MTKKRNWVIWFVAAAGIKIFSFFPGAVEKYYSRGVYLYIAGFLRSVFGWIPFSIGDILYMVAGIYLFYKLIWFIRTLAKRQADKAYFSLGVKRIGFTILVVYVLFNLLWGLNYNRYGIAYQLHLNVQPYSTGELQGILQVIVERMNALDSAARLQRNELNKKKILFSNCVEAYKRLENENSIFGYISPSVKPSIFSYAGNYLGFTGYYNPFSGEAQVNTTVPIFVQPFTTCHEIGHQLGYAKENEANFAGYLSAKLSRSKAFQYSVYFDLYLYAARELYVRDSTLLVPLRESLRPAIRSDYRELREFYKKYENPLEPIISKLYGNYLKANQQPQGIMSYNEVIAWLIAYENKYGKPAV
ncbi:MAG TPA: DUF3810 domain-containing protein [Puia sp.]|jgi:hypothetical protein|nr:DUF3810 domain-containing protein [Puia sp.]